MQSRVSRTIDVMCGELGVDLGFRFGRTLEGLIGDAIPGEDPTGSEMKFRNATQTKTQVRTSSAGFLPKYILLGSWLRTIP